MAFNATNEMVALKEIFPRGNNKVIIYFLPHHLFYLDMCDVTTYVTPTVGICSLTYDTMCALQR